MGLTPSPPSPLCRHWPFAGRCEPILSPGWVSPLPQPLLTDLQPQTSFTTGVVLGWWGPKRMWWSQHGLENSECVTNISVTRTKHPGSEEEQPPDNLRAWKKKRFRSILFERNRVQSEPECTISWRKFCNWLHIMPVLFVLQLQSPHTWVQCLWSLHSSKHNSLSCKHTKDTQLERIYPISLVHRTSESLPLLVWAVLNVSILVVSVHPHRSFYIRFKCSWLT